MHPVLARTFGGLSAHYYFRQLCFGLLFPAMIAFVVTHGKQAHPTSPGLYALLIANTLLYPYARFVYERIVAFIVGNNVFFANALLMLTFKFMTMAMCWCFALVVAPIGLLYRYVHHTRNAPS